MRWIKTGFDWCYCHWVIVNLFDYKVGDVGRFAELSVVTNSSSAMCARAKQSISPGGIRFFPNVSWEHYKQCFVIEAGARVYRLDCSEISGPAVVNRPIHVKEIQDHTARVTKQLKPWRWSWMSPNPQRALIRGRRNSASWKRKLQRRLPKCPKLSARLAGRQSD